MARSSEPLGVAAFTPAFTQATGEPAWMQSLREAGAARFRESGLPTNREEAWKYTSLRPLARAKYESLDQLTETPLPVPPPLQESAAQAVFVNGRFHAGLSDLKGVETEVGEWSSLGGADWLAATVGKADAGTQQMYALNAASFTDGLAIQVKAGHMLARPLEVVYLAALEDRPLMWHPRLAIDIEENAEAVVIERHIGPTTGAYLANHAADIRIGDGARFVHAKLQSEGAEGRHLSMSRIRVGKVALYDNFILTLGAALSRSEAAVRLEGEGCEVRLNGAYSIGGRQHADHTSRIDHLAEGTRSRQVFAGAIGENARGVFQGHIVVDRLAQRTDGHQLNRALLLSDHAEINSKPILEIYADDVKCSHGATAGDIDDDQLFYLRARGIPADKARMLVVRGFLAEAAGGISNADVKAAILDTLDEVIGVEIAL
jgi:Fe-S cluster assembly protein SufD